MIATYDNIIAAATNLWTQVCLGPDPIAELRRLSGIDRPGEPPRIYSGEAQASNWLARKRAEYSIDTLGLEFEPYINHEILAENIKEWTDIYVETSEEGPASPVEFAMLEIVGKLRVDPKNITYRVAMKSLRKLSGKCADVATVEQVMIDAKLRHRRAKQAEADKRHADSKKAPAG